MNKEFKKYIKNKYIVFSVNIEQKYNDNEKCWKIMWIFFTLMPPNKWYILV